jgi:flagellar hook-associated protein 1 FlgK
MSLSAALTVALTGIKTSSTATQVISGNLANAQTAGYTVKSVDLTEVTNGSILGGVSVSGYSRVSDSVLSATYNSATSNASYLSTQNGYMSQVQSVLDSSSNPPAFSAAVANFQSAWTQFSAAPEDVTQQKAVVAAGEQLAGVVNTISSNVQSLQTQVQTDLSSTTTSLNNFLSQVQTLNTQIAGATAANQPTGDLQDQRDQVINQISGIVNVQILSRPNGQVALYTPGGTALIDGQAQVFSASTNTVTNAVGADMSSILTGGKMQAQIDFLSNSTSNTNGVGVINKLESQLQNYTNMFVSTASTPNASFASTYNSATTASGEQASSFFTATIESNGLPDLSSFQVNASLVSGATSVKQSAGAAISNTFNASNLAIDNSQSPTVTSGTFTSTGLIAQNQTYAQLSNSILSGFQQQANAISSASTTATTQETYYKNALSSETGVNTDTELVNLTNWQNAYAASAHVISTIQSMFQTLEQLLG